MTDHSRAWLERMIEACQGASDRLEHSDDPQHEPLLRDIKALQARLEGELDELV